MAVIKFGSVVTSGSGSIGGSTIQPDRSGHIWRTKPLPLKSRTPAQSLIRSYNKTMQAGWRSLAEGDRKIWNDYAQLHHICNRAGDKHPLSGHSLWLKYQFYQLQCNLPFLSSPSEYVDLSIYCQASQCYIRRVRSDGGQVNDYQLTDNLFRELITLDAVTVFTVGFAPYAGVKLRVDGSDLYVTKYYNLFNDNDLVQAVNISQFRYAQNQIGGIDILTGLNSKMYFTPVLLNSFITVNAIGNSTTTGHFSLFGNYISPGGIAVRYRSACPYGLHTLIPKPYRVDSLIVSALLVDAWRNNVVSVSNPQPGCSGLMDGIGARGGTSYWNGYYGVQLASPDVITTTIRESLTTFFMNQFSIV